MNAEKFQEKGSSSRVAEMLLLKSEIVIENIYDNI